MDPVEEVAYRNRPPLLEDVSIRGPLRIPIKDAMQTLEEREAIEADFRWYRWSKFAAPWLFFLLLLCIALFCLTAWQQIGNMKWFNAQTVGNDLRPWGVPRHQVLTSETKAEYEGGMPKYLRNVRIATVFIGLFAILGVFATLLSKPRPNIRKSLNFLWCLMLFITFILAVCCFIIGIDKVKGAKRCEWADSLTHEKCTVRKGVATIAIALDAGVFFGALVSCILLAMYNASGDWKLLRTGWRERERDAEKEVVNRAEGADKFLRKVRPVRITILTGVLLFTLACILVLTVFIIILHMDHHKWSDLQSWNGGVRGKNLNERPGWSTRNTRLRYATTIIGIMTILFNMIPFSHRAIAYMFAFLYFIVAIMAFVTFGFDLGEIQRAHRLTCPEQVRCRYSAFIATTIIDMFVGLSALFYILYEYVAKNMTVSRWSGRNYCPHEIYKHDTKLDSMRPVRCELTGHVMTAKEYVYRYRFIAGTGGYFEEPAVSTLAPTLAAPPVAPAPYVVV
eukprot:NODE_1586_length_1674_cov_449.505480_g1508_i0.p1 GENE.NODE_1586_length_1674_cov_449.505480_g1508_i0~~NODE_1586_length_1674_cov_449.505480_g1508_i0.p1  ORF type:complete len:508 (+),score=121.17 NODE_1586_length_1674_cov_449.505480_g1508_i0:62-1585(+)